MVGFGSGLTTMGIYRLSGTTSAVQKLKAAFDQGSSRPSLPLSSLVFLLLN